MEVFLLDKNTPTCSDATNEAAYAIRVHPIYRRGARGNTAGASAAVKRSGLSFRPKAYLLSYLAAHESLTKALIS